MNDVTLIDSMGSDLSVVNAARVSFKKYVKNFRDRDEELIKYLSENNHFTPFTHCAVTLHFKMPIFTARQWVKSTVGLSISDLPVNEVSRRYVDDDPEFFNPDYWRRRSETLKQGSLDDPADEQWYLWSIYNESVDLAFKVYKEMIERGVAPEQARIVLPQSMYTEFYETGSLYAYARIYNLRGEGTHAQKEIQVYAEQVGKIMNELFPISWKYLTKKED